MAEALHFYGSNNPNGTRPPVRVAGSAPHVQLEVNGTPRFERRDPGSRARRGSGSVAVAATAVTVTVTVPLAVTVGRGRRSAAAAAAAAAPRAARRELAGAQAGGGVGARGSRTTRRLRPAPGASSSTVESRVPRFFGVPGYYGSDPAARSDSEWPQAGLLLVSRILAGSVSI